jgi:hypothetical protein
MKKGLPDLEQCNQLIRLLFPDLPRQKRRDWGKKNSEILKFSNSNPKNSEGKY